MKVLMFGWEFPPFNSGGLGVACQGLSRALSENHVDLTFVLPKKVKTEENFKFKFADNVFIEVKYVDSPLTPYITSDQYGLEYLFQGESIYGPSLFEEVMRYSEAARRIAIETPHDIIHAHDWLSYPAGLASKKISGKPLVAHVHATEFDRTGNGNINKRVYAVEKAGFLQSDHIIGVSNFTKHIVSEQYGIPEGKISVVHNGIRVDDYNREGETDKGILRLKKAGNKMVLFVGRLTLQKGPDYFIYAAKKVLVYSPNTFFVIAGSGDMEGRVMELSAALGISDKIIFTGFLRDEALSRVYRSADVFVMPSVSEPFGITPLEALIHGTPVIVSKQSGVSEVVTHALKVDFWDVDELADKILSVITYKPLQNVMGENGYREVQNCTWDKAAKKVIEVYNHLAVR